LLAFLKSFFFYNFVYDILKGMVFVEMGQWVELSLFLVLETYLSCIYDTCKEGSFVSIHSQEKKYDR
jgi:hypothetical protein